VGSYRDRHVRGLDVYRTIRGNPDLDLERVSRAMAKGLGPLGALAIDHVLGDLWSRPQLGRRDRSFVSVTALTCLGAENELRTHIGGALNHGAAAEEIEELILHVSAYAGYPRAFESMRVALAIFAERDDTGVPREWAEIAEVDDDARHASGLEALGGLTGLEPADVPAAIEPLGDVVRFAVDYLFGQIWSRPQLPPRDRSLITLTALVTLGKVAELEIHVPGALRNGLGREQIEEVILQLTLYAGYPAAVEAIRATRRIFAELDGAAPDEESS
jgi:4-carboxymuconolactone decarboxylase